MSHVLWLVAAALFIIDVALRPWGTRSARLPHAVNLAVPWGGLVAIQLLPPIGIVGLAAVIALTAAYSFMRLVGLSEDQRFASAAFVGAMSFYVVAPLDWYALFQALPAFSVLLVVVAGTLKDSPKAFLQKLCLSWLIVLVYGYLFAHSALLALSSWSRFGISGAEWLAAVTLIAKAGDVAWVIGMRLGAKDPMHSPVHLIGATLGGVALALLGAHAVTGLSWSAWAVLGALIGLSAGLASRAYVLIITDVMGETNRDPQKGAVLFGFAFALALAYHYLRYLS